MSLTFNTNNVFCLEKPYQSIFDSCILHIIFLTLPKYETLQLKNFSGPLIGLWRDCWVWDEMMYGAGSDHLWCDDSIRAERILGKSEIEMSCHKSQYTHFNAHHIAQQLWHWNCYKVSHSWKFNNFPSFQLHKLIIIPTRFSAAYTPSYIKVLNTIKPSKQQYRFETETWMKLMDGLLCDTRLDDMWQ